MENILLIGMVLLVFGIGYFMVKKVGEVLEESGACKEEEHVMKEPDFVMISGDKPLMEIDMEISEYKKKHEAMQIILCDKSTMCYNEEMEVDTVEQRTGC